MIIYNNHYKLQSSLSSLVYIICHYYLRRYSSRQSAGQRGESDWGVGSSRCPRIEPGLEVFSRPTIGTNKLLAVRWKVVANTVRLDRLENDKTAIKQASFRLSSRIDSDEFGFMASSLVNNTSTSQISAYLGSGGQSLKQAFVILLIWATDPSEVPDMPLWNLAIADLYPQTVRY